MKKATLLIALLLPFIASAQTTRFISPTGSIKVEGVGASITNNTSATFFADTIKAGSLDTGRILNFEFRLSITAPAINLPAFSLTLNIGGNPYNLLTAAPISGLLTSGAQSVAVKVRIHVRSRTSAKMFVDIEQPPFLLGLTNSNSANTFTVPISYSSNQIIALVGSLGVGLGATTVTDEFNLRPDF